MLDVFHSDAFNVVSLTDAINKMVFVPGYIGSTGIFQETAVAVTSVAIEEGPNGIVTLIPPTPRGAPGTTLNKNKRSMRLLSIPHFEVNDAVMAEEVQGVRAFGSETAVESVMGKVAERMQIAGQSFEATQEKSRVGAVMGVVTYADGSTLDLFHEFGVAGGVPAETDWDLDNANPANGVVRKKCAATYRAMGAVLDGIPFTGITAICGDAFFDDLIAHAEVTKTYLNYQAAADLRQGYVSAGQIWGAFPFGGILWVNYRGSVGGSAFVNTDKAFFYPTGVPGLFRTVYAPADYIETVNTMGRPRYVKQYDMPNGKGVHLDTQMNAVNYCTRPACLMRGKRT